MADLVAAFRRGAEFKVGLSEICDDLWTGKPALQHEVFVQCGSVYLYTEQPLFVAATHPIVRVARRSP